MFPLKTTTILLKLLLSPNFYEEKQQTLEKERTNALEMATKTHEKGKTQTKSYLEIF